MPEETIRIAIPVTLAQLAALEAAALAVGFTYGKRQRPHVARYIASIVPELRDMADAEMADAETAERRLAAAAEFPAVVYRLAGGGGETEPR